MLRFHSLHRLYRVTSIRKANLEPWQDYATEGYPETYRDRVAKIEQEVAVDYKAYPYLPHQDPKSKARIPSELDDYHDKTKVEAFNRVLNQFKYDLNLQRQIWAAIDNLERTYKNGQKGVTTNLNDEVTGPKLADLGFERENLEDFNFGFKNEDALIASAVWQKKYKPETIREWEVEYLNRPVTKHFHPDKGYKYDVPVKPEEKYEFLADRLGHPEFFGTPFERLLKIEKEIYHPNFIDQPFIHTPSNKPHESLSFEEGEVIYEHAGLQEWINFWKYFGTLAFFFICLWTNYQFLYKTRLTSDYYGVRKMVWLRSPKTERNKREKARKNTLRLDRFRVILLVATLGVPALTFVTLKIIHQVTRNYIIKMSYSVDKELIFLKRVGTFGRLQEEVVETAHLECLPPSAITGIKDLSSNNPNGLWQLINMASVNYNDSILVYNNDKFWNPKLKKEFLQGRLGLWDKSIYGMNRQESKDALDEIEREINESYGQKALPA